MDEKQIKKELFGRLPFKDRFFIQVSRYMPSIIRRRILVRYVPFLVSKAVEYGFRKAKDEMGDEAFLRVLDQLPTNIEDKDGVWTLPAGTTKEEVAQFLMRLKEQEVGKEMKGK